MSKRKWTIVVFASILVVALVGGVLLGQFLTGKFSKPPEVEITYASSNDSSEKPLYEYTTPELAWGTNSRQFRELEYDEGFSVRVQKLPYEVAITHNEIWIYNGQELSYYTFNDIFKESNPYEMWGRASYLVKDDIFYLLVDYRNVGYPDEPNDMKIEYKRWYNSKRNFIAKFDLKTTKLLNIEKLKRGIVLDKEVVDDTLYLVQDVSNFSDISQRLAIDKFLLDTWEYVNSTTIDLHEQQIKHIFADELYLANGVVTMNAVDSIVGNIITLEIDETGKSISRIPPLTELGDGVVTFSYVGRWMGDSAISGTVQITLEEDGTYLKQLSEDGDVIKILSEGTWLVKENEIIFIEADTEEIIIEEIYHQGVDEYHCVRIGDMYYYLQIG